MTMWNNVILCLGSNTDCEANLKSAVSLLRAYFGSIRFSEAIYTEPIGLSDSGLFLNQVAVAGTNASLEEVRRAVKAMEKRLGRMSDSKQKGKIPIDIDLLLYGDRVLDTRELKLPHPLMHERRFWLEPLVEIAPDLVHPVLKKKMLELMKTQKSE